MSFIIRVLSTGTMACTSNNPLAACGFHHKLKLLPYCVKALPQCALNSGSSLRRMCQHPPPLQFMLKMALYCTSFLIQSLYLIGPRHSVSLLWFHHSSRLIQVRPLVVLWRHSPSWTCWRDAGIGIRISELDIGWCPPSEYSK